jgi:hypothetical protein
MNAEAVIPSKRNRKVFIPHDQALYKDRNRIARCFNRMMTASDLYKSPRKQAHASSLRGDRDYFAVA